MKPAATIFAAVASMGLVSACATANGQTSNDSAAPVLAAASDSDGERKVRVRRFIFRDRDFEAIIDNYDNDGDGKISREEYHGQSNRGRFAELDADDDGFIDLAELESDMEERMGERMERMGERMERHAERAMRDAERHQKRLMKRLDRNGDGEIDGDDFDFDFNFDFDEDAFGEKMEGFKGRMEERMQKHRERTLKKLDSDADGVVSREEFAARQNKRFDELDKDDNGTLSADELDGMAMIRGLSLPGMPHIERFGMGRHDRGRHDRGHHKFLWNDKDDGETDEESGDAEE